MLNRRDSAPARTKAGRGNFQAWDSLMARPGAACNFLRKRDQGTASPGRSGFLIAALRPRMRGQVPSELPRAYQTRMMKSRRGDVFRSACGEVSRSGQRPEPDPELLWPARISSVVVPQESLEPDCRSGGSFHQPRPMSEYNEVSSVPHQHPDSEQRPRPSPFRKRWEECPLGSTNQDPTRMYLSAVRNWLTGSLGRTEARRTRKS